MAKKPLDIETFMAQLDHSLKPEVEALRAIIKGVNPGISEQVKWNAPSFSYGDEYLATFHLRPTNYVHLVFHHPKTPTVTSEILEGTYADGRRMAYFTDMDAVVARQAELERVIAELVALS
jgi:hypothetical protein